MPKPAHKPTDETRAAVQSMAAYGVPEYDIAKVVGIDPKTLRKHYRPELDRSHVRANHAVAGKLYDQCMRGNVTAQIFWLKTRAGWREKDIGDNSNDTPPPMEVKFDVAEPVDEVKVTRHQKAEGKGEGEEEGG